MVERSPQLKGRIIVLELGLGLVERPTQQAYGMWRDLVDRNPSEEKHKLYYSYGGRIYT
jgi:hypothetical protein